LGGRGDHSAVTGPAPDLVLAYVGLGSNLGDRLGFLRAAVARLDAEPGVRVTRGSRIYETAPVGNVDQGWFLNAVAEVQTNLEPRALLERLLAIEESLGRVRGVRGGPRTIDFDLLIHADARLKDPACTVPHPRLEERAFVVAPLAELAPERRLPGGLTAAERARELRGGPQGLGPYPAGLLPPEVDGRPDVLTAEVVGGALARGRFGRPWHAAGEVESTNDWARALAAAGAPEGAVATAEVQLAGRGRGGRVWFSPGDWGLWMSVVLRPEASPDRTPELTLVAGLALADAVTELARVELELKWPNDLIVGGRKVAGILTEGRTFGGRLASAVVGIGVNVNTPTEAFPAALGGRAGSLLGATGRPFRRSVLAARLLAALEARYRLWQAEGFAGLREDYLARLAWRGDLVEVREGSTAQAGRVEDVDESGQLRLSRDDGSTLVVRVGEVSLRRPGGGSCLSDGVE